MASMCFKRLKYLTNNFTILEMTSEFEKRLTYLGNEVSMWEIP